MDVRVWGRARPNQTRLSAKHNARGEAWISRSAASASASASGG
jgi:hypothetical protein